MTMNKTIIALIVVGVLLAGILGYYLYTNSPAYILSQVDNALQEHSWEDFTKYVDIELGTKLLSEKKTEQEKYKARLVKLVLDKKWMKELSTKYYGDETEIAYVKDNNNIATVGLKAFFTRYDTAVIAEFDILRSSNKLVSFNNLNAYFNSVDSLEQIRIDSLNKYLKDEINNLLQFEYKTKVLKRDFFTATSIVKIIMHNNSQDTIIEYKSKVKMYDPDVGLFQQVIHGEHYNDLDTTLWYSAAGNFERTEVDTFENLKIPPKQKFEGRHFELKNNLYIPNKIKHQVLYIKFSDGTILKYPLKPYEDLFNENLRRGLEKYIIPVIKKKKQKSKKQDKTQET